MSDSPSELGRTLESFNRLSAELTAGYRRLEERAARLESQLGSSQREKLRLAGRLSALIDSLPGAVVVLDEHEQVRQSNATADRWFGAEATGLAWSELLSWCEAAPATDSHELTLPDGRIVSVSRSRSADRRETVVLLTDVTLDRQLQAELHRNRRLVSMGEMAARAAHQVRTPLSVALLYIGQVETDAGLPDDLRPSVEKITRQLHRLDHMTRDMLVFVRAPDSASSNLSLRDLLDDVTDLAHAGKPEKARFECIPDAVSPDDVVIRGDRHALSGALGNLVDNAWLAGADSATIRVDLTGPDEQFLELRVADDGCGIAAEIQERVFEPFFSDSGNGTGLGLPVARSTLELHGGKLEIEKSDLSGTVFLARLPVDDRRTGIGGHRHKAVPA